MDRNLHWNDILAFVLEIASLIFWCLWVWQRVRTPIGRIALTALSMAGLMLLWAMLFAPTAEYRLTMPWLLVGKLLVLLQPGLLYFAGRPRAGIAWAALVILHLTAGGINGNL